MAKANKSSIEIARSVIEREAKALLDVASRIDGKFDEAIDVLYNAKNKVIVTALGKSGHIGKKIVATLCSTGTPAVFLHAAEAVHGDLGVYQPGDPTILISKSGSTAELDFLLPSLKRHKSPIIAILGNLKSPLAEKADIVLDGSVDGEIDPLGIVPTASALVALAIGDAIASVLMEKRGFTKEEFATFHPSGQLGRNLLLKVEDVMQKTDSIAKVSLESSVKEVVIQMTKYSNGAACVVSESNELEGIITDGDLRRILQEHDDIRLLKAKDVMTANPITVDPKLSLIDTLKLMEDRPAQISVLPVQDNDSTLCLGLIRLHDIYQPTK